jgi:hypothetical protein
MTTSGIKRPTRSTVSSLARIDGHAGRATSDFETVRLFDGLRGWKGQYGDWVDYYRLDPAVTYFDDVYEEVTGNGRQYLPVVRLGCLHVALIQGGNTMGDKGFYMNDDIRALVPYDIYEGTGMSLSDLNTGTYEMDRIVYKSKVFQVNLISIAGQIQERPTMVAIDASQVKPDQLIEDTLFRQYEENPTP